MKASRPLLATAAALLALTLAACSDEPDAARTENLSTAEDDASAVEAAPAPAPVAAPTPIPEPTMDANATADLAPEPVTPPDEQMLDDASATGMTARASRDQPANDEPATGEVEQK